MAKQSNSNASSRRPNKPREQSTETPAASAAGFLIIKTRTLTYKNIPGTIQCCTSFRCSQRRYIVPNAVLSNNENETYLSLDISQMVLTPEVEPVWNLGVYPCFKFVNDIETQERRVLFLLHNGQTVFSDFTIDATSFIEDIHLQLRWIKKHNYAGSHVIVLANEIMNHYNFTISIDVAASVRIILGAHCITRPRQPITHLHYIDPYAISHAFLRKFFPAFAN